MPINVKKFIKSSAPASKTGAIDINKFIKKTPSVKSENNIKTEKKEYKTPGGSKIIEEGGVKTVYLADQFGGGVFKTNSKGELILSERSQDPIGSAISGKERDHIIPVSLSGVSVKENLQYLKSPEGTKFGAKNRQGGKLETEEQVISEYKKGNIGLDEARAKILNKQQEIKGLKPEEKSWFKFLPEAAADTIVNAALSINGFFKK